MKYIKARKDLMFLLNPLLILTGILLFCFLPHEINSFFNILKISLFCALFLILTPLGNQRLTQKNSEATRLPGYQWIALILLLEIILYGVYAGICFIQGNALLINVTQNTALFSHSIQTQLLSYGLFPWSLYAVIAVGMGVLAYCQQTDGYFSNLLKPLTKQEPDKIISAMINIGARRCTLFALVTMLMFMIFFIVSLFLSLKKFIPHEFEINTLLTTLVLFVVAYTQLFKRYVIRLFSRKIPTLISFPIFCVVLGFIILILNQWTLYIAQHAAAQHAPSIILHWINYNSTVAWSIFSVIFWICLTPMVCSFITRISKGYKIRYIVLGVLTLPFLINFYFIACAHHQLTPFLFSPWIIKAGICLSFLILLPLLVNHASSSNAIVSYFPQNGIIKARDEQPFFISITRLTIVFIYFYLVIGINGMSLFVFALNYMAIVSLLITSIAILKNIFYTHTDNSH